MNTNSMLKKGLITLAIVFILVIIYGMLSEEITRSPAFPVATIEPTKVTSLTEKSDPNLIASDFIDSFKYWFQFFEEEHNNPPIPIKLAFFGFDYNNKSNLLDLLLETKSDESLIQDKTALTQSIAVLSVVLEENWKLPEEINGVWFIQADNNTVIREAYFLDWGTLMDYVAGNITSDQLMKSLQISSPIEPN